MSDLERRLREVVERMGPSAFEHAAEALHDQADQASDPIVVQATKIRAVDFLEVAACLHAIAREREAMRASRPEVQVSEVGDLPNVDLDDPWRKN